MTGYISIASGILLVALLAGHLRDLASVSHALLGGVVQHVLNGLWVAASLLALPGVA